MKKLAVKTREAIEFIHEEDFLNLTASSDLEYGKIYNLEIDSFGVIQSATEIETANPLKIKECAHDLSNARKLLGTAPNIDDTSVIEKFPVIQQTGFSLYQALGSVAWLNNQIQSSKNAIKYEIIKILE